METSVLDVIRVKVSAFRIAEAKEVLTQLGMSKNGRKDELNARILTIFQDAATLTAQGHRLRDQGRVDAAAAIVDNIFQRLVRAQHPPAVAAAAKLWQQNHNGSNDRDHAAASGGGSAGVAGDQAAAAQQGPPKRIRLTTLLPQHPQFRGPGTAAAAAAAAAAGHVEEVITAFMNNEEGIGATNTKVRCVCSQHTAKEPMLQCEGAFCGVWQHAACVRQQLLHLPLVPLVPGGDKFPQRRQFFCERCRIARADPFWEVYDALVMPPQLGKPSVARMMVYLPTGQQTEWMVSRAGPAKISLSSQQVRLLQQSPQEYQLQALALCLDDSIQFRSQWPTAPLLKLGDKALKVHNRLASAQLGPMQRDMPANLTSLVSLAPLQEHGGMCVDLLLEFADPLRSCVLLAYIMRRRTKEQVKALMKPAEPLTVAVQRMKQFMNPRGNASSSNPASGGGTRPHGQVSAAAAAHDDDAQVISDNDDDIVVGNRVVSLKDPNTFMRIVQPARFIDTSSNDLQVFDLDTFLDMAQSTLKWIDPHSMKSSCVQNLQVDTYLAHILAGLAHQPDVLEVEINTDAEWRPAGSSRPFMSVLAPGGAAAAAAVGAAAAAAAAGGSSSDEEDEMAELRRAASEMRRGKQHEVIELLDSDEEEDQQPAPRQQQQQQAAGGGGGGLRIQLPSRAQQQQQHLQQQQAVAAAAAAAAAAVGPSVPRLPPGAGAPQMTAAVGVGVMSPRALAVNVQQPHQQHPAQHLGGGVGPSGVQRVGSGHLQYQQPPLQQLPGSAMPASGPPQGMQMAPMQYQLLQTGQQSFLFPMGVAAGMQLSPLGPQQYAAAPPPASGMMQQGAPQQFQPQLQLQGSLPQMGSGALQQQQQQQQVPGQVMYMQQQ